VAGPVGGSSPVLEGPPLLDGSAGVRASLIDQVDGGLTRPRWAGAALMVDVRGPVFVRRAEYRPEELIETAGRQARWPEKVKRLAVARSRFAETCTEKLIGGVDGVGAVARGWSPSAYSVADVGCGQVATRCPALDQVGCIA